MKIKILLVISIVVLSVCLFAISVSASEYTPNFGTVTKVDGMTDKATFGNDGKFDTFTSRVLMNDGITYPAYYILADQTTMKIDFSALNTNAQKSYDRSSLIAFELCEGITHIASCWNNNGFQGDRFKPNIEYLRVPSSLIDISTDAPFYKLSKLKVVANFENTKVTTIPSRGFEGCPIEEMSFPSTLISIANGSLNAFAGELDLSNTSITVIDEINFQNNSSIKGVKLSDLVTSIGPSAFKGCSSIEYVIGGAGLKTIGATAFSGCSSLKTIDFSKSSLDTIGLRSFFECTKLELVNLGNIKKLETQSFYKAGINSEKSFVVFYISASLQEIYNEYGTIWQSAKTSVIYYTGTDNDNGIAAIKKNISVKNDSLINAKAEGFDKNATYSANTIVYNYNKCDAFYGGVHNTDTVTFDFTDFTSKMYENSACARNCGLETVTLAEHEPIFSGVKFSIKENGNALCASYSVNKASLAIYNKYNEGATLSYGVVASVGLNEGESLLELDGGKVVTEKTNAVIASVDEKYVGFDFVLTGFSAEYENVKLIICAYVTDGKNIYYIGTNTSKVPFEVTMAEIKKNG